MKLNFSIDRGQDRIGVRGLELREGKDDSVCFFHCPLGQSILRGLIPAF